MSLGTMGRLQPVPKLKRRTRKLSSDSGCEMGRQARRSEQFESIKFFKLAILK